MKQYTIIVAGGSGTRMGSSIPKQFLALKSRPVLMHTIEKMHECLPQSEIIVALPKTEINRWKDLCQQHQFQVQYKLCQGGNTRFESVQNALQHIEKDSVVAIHDGVRPFIQEKVFNRFMQIAQEKGAAIPTIPIVESLRQKTKDGTLIVNRDDYLIVQTPQCFKSQIILDAYQLDYQTKFTDDASVVETLGTTIQTVVGNKENIKITTPEDLKIAEIYLG